MKLIDKTEFDLMSREEKIAAIAKDVILRLDQDLLRPSKDDMFFIPSEFLEEDQYGENDRCRWINFEDDELPNTDVQKYLNTKPCEVCARGALLCSYVGNFNHHEWDFFQKNSGTGESLNGDIVEIFGKSLLDCIEAAYEGDVFKWHDDRDLAQDYSVNFEERNSLREIMEHLITNNGTFPLHGS